MRPPPLAASPTPPTAPPPSPRRRVILEQPAPTSSPARSPRAPGSHGGGDFKRPFRRGGVQLPPTPRNIAAEVVARVERDGAFAAAVLDHELKRAAQLSPRDRALATELLYGTLRLKPLLEKSVEAVTPRGIQALDPRTRALLLVAAYQIHYTRIPAFAAVSEAVEAVRATKGRAVGGFANGALRQLAASAETAPLPRPPLAYKEATAPWLRRALERSIGEDATDALLMAGPVPPPINLRVRNGGAGVEATRDAWVTKLREAAPNAKIDAADQAPGAIRVRNAGDPHQLPGYAEGAWTIQEEGSQLVGHLLGVRPGEIVLDACAGRGNKTSLLAEALESDDGRALGRLDAADLHPDKLSRLDNELTRLKLAKAVTYGVDWAVGTGDVPLDTYDRVLVDAPCSGTGTIRRRPEIQTRRQALDLIELANTQVAILSNAASVVRPGGRLVYAVCSVLRDEAEAVVARVLDARKDLELVAFDAPIATRLFSDDATQGRILTHLHGTDSYFVASLRRRA
ncbi:MAG: Sun protein [Deltaproteobacteria bacterium]|nr:Sun protein [Deltaproteobacteria bacterium]